ncbi:hypothetical protein NDU88_004421 [Pleurodeles waltl]|uniref:Uncharacterized protein n=1 Tax=Pleurodeles waltl TaxID=8319 RepID=A0AAV7SIT3_PLEWA|nr:hypothetical protein NDU88_004421 [Pleurodeles waltl]
MRSSRRGEDGWRIGGRLVAEDVKEKELGFHGQGDNDYELFYDVCEITCGAISEYEWKDAMKEDVELRQVCKALESGSFGSLNKVWFLVKNELAVDDVGEMCDVLKPLRAQVSTEMPRENPRAVSEVMRSSRRGEDGWRIGGR